MELILYPVGFPNETSFLFGLDAAGIPYRYPMDAFWNPTTNENLLAVLDAAVSAASLSAAASLLSANNAAASAVAAADSADDFVAADTVPKGYTILQLASLTPTPGTVVYVEDTLALTDPTWHGVVGSMVPGAAVTIDNATPGLIHWTAHGLVANTQVVFATSGVLPTGLTAGTHYYVISTGLVTDAFEVSATTGGAAINTSSDGSGVHTATATGVKTVHDLAFYNGTSWLWV